MSVLNEWIEKRNKITHGLISYYETYFDERQENAKYIVKNVNSSHQERRLCELVLKEQKLHKKQKKNEQRKLISVTPDLERTYKHIVLEFLTLLIRRTRSMQG